MIKNKKSNIIDIPKYGPNKEIENVKGKFKKRGWISDTNFWLYLIDISKERIVTKWGTLKIKELKEGNFPAMKKDWIPVVKSLHWVSSRVKDGR